VRRLALALLLAAACEDTSYKEIGGEINVLTQRTDALVPPAIRRLAGWKRRALPQVEIALHTASPAGKVNLVHALEAIGDPESAAILRHFAVYDPDPEVRTACDELLARWSEAPAPLGPAAHAAQASVASRRQQGEGPVVLGSPAK
jgi:HEAT repeat protein